MILNRPRPCVNGCGATVEWAFDRRRRVGLIESVSREAHLCPKRLLGAYIACACGAPIHTYADGAVEDARTKLPHECKPGQPATTRVAGPPALPPPAVEPEPRESLAEQLGL